MLRGVRASSLCPKLSYLSVLSIISIFSSNSWQASISHKDNWLTAEPDKVPVDADALVSFPSPLTLHPHPVPCAPQNVSATLVCLDRSALVSWAGSPSAVGYNVTVTGRAAHTHHGHSNTTSSQLPGIHCGDTYGITVTPYSETCTGHTSAVYSFEAGAERLACITHKYPYIQAQGDQIKPHFSPLISRSLRSE